VNSHLGRAISFLLLISAPAATLAQQAPDESEISDKLRECLALRTSGEDRITVMRWMTASFGMSPYMADIVTIAPGKKFETDKKMADLFTRLVTDDCLEHVKKFPKSKIYSALEISGEKMGELGALEILSNKETLKYLEAYTEALNDDDFSKLSD
jgi:hypothetical protein